MAATPQVGGEHPRDRPDPVGQQRQRHQEPADQPDRQLQRGAERPGRPVADRATASRKPITPMATAVTSGRDDEHERAARTRCGCRTRTAPTAGSRPGCTGRSSPSTRVIGRRPERERGGRGDEQLEGALAALLLQRGRGRGADRGPHAHDAGADGRGRRRAASSPSWRYIEEAPSSRRTAGRRSPSAPSNADRLRIFSCSQPADRDQAQRPAHRAVACHCVALTSSTYASSSVGSRVTTRPTRAPVQTGQDRPGSPPRRRRC